MTKTHIIGIIIAFFFLEECFSQTGVVIQRDEKCLEYSEYKLGPISYNDTLQNIITKNGKPHKRTVDDRLNLEILEYKDIIITIQNKRVVSLATSSPQYKTPSGIHCGMSKKQVMEIIGFKRYKKSISEYQFVCCPPEHEIYMVIKFNKNNLVMNIELGSDIP